MPRNDFIASLHGLRGIAVLYVVFSHIGNAGMALVPLPHNAVGKVGVWIFFGLSAYLLTTKLRDQLAVSAAPGTIGRYFVHRVFRIYPLFILVLLTHMAVGDMTASSVVRHLALIEGQGELWAISTEFQFYVVLPLLALAPRRVALAACAAMLAAALAYGVTSPDAVFSNGLLLLPKAAPFALAAMFAIWRPVCRFGLASGLLGLALLMACTVAYRHLYVAAAPPTWITPWLGVAIGIAVCALILAAIQPGAFQRLLSARWLVWIGEISFSLYLLHMFVVRAVQTLQAPSYVAGWLALAGAVALASLTYRLIEEPGIRAGRAVADRIGLSPRASAETM